MTYKDGGSMPTGDQLDKQLSVYSVVYAIFTMRIRPTFCKDRVRSSW